MAAFRGFLIAGFWLLSLAVLPATAQGLDPSLLGRLPALNPRLEQARKDLAERRFLQVVQDLEPCLRVLPDHFEAHFLLAQVAYEGRDFEGALHHMRVAEQNLQDLAKLFQDRQEAVRIQDELDLMEATGSYDQLAARGVDPGGCSGVLYRVRKRAIEDLEAKKGHLHDLDLPFVMPAAYHFLHGNCCYRLGHRDAARAQYRETVRLDPAHAAAWNNLISLQWETRDYAAARADLARAEAAQVIIHPNLKRALLEDLAPLKAAPPGQGESHR